MWSKVSCAGENPSEILETPFNSMTGGVMTVEVGAITGELELLTRPAPDESGIEALVRYAGARDLYCVAGSPVHLDHAEVHRDAHQRILQHLTAPAGVENFNELPADVTGV